MGPLGGTCGAFLRPFRTKRSSKGDPGGNSNGRGFDLVVTVVVVDIFTTEGINLSARSAKDDGIELANEKEK